MDIKKIVIIAAVVLLALIGFNYYSSAQSEKARTTRMAETEALRASIPQPVAVPVEPNTSEPTTKIMSDDEIAAANKEVINAANKEMSAARESRYATDEASNSSYAANKASIDTSKKQICDSVTSISETAMRARLNGVPIQTTLATLDSTNDGSDAGVKINAIYTAVVMDAYRKPNFSTNKYKDNAIREFALANYLTCVDAVAKW